jgi:hypothetical protein
MVALFSCDNVTITNPSGTLTIKSDSTRSVRSFTILQAGLPPPPLYINAEDIVAKKYNIVNVFAAGCIISESLGDSIETFNMNSYHELNKYYKKDMREVIYNETDKQYRMIKDLDSLLRVAPELKDKAWTKDQFPYFVKTPQTYVANFIVGSDDKKSGSYIRKLRLQVAIDSATKKIKSLTDKDSIIKTDFRELQQ